MLIIVGIQGVSACLQLFSPLRVITGNGEHEKYCFYDGVSLFSWDLHHTEIQVLMFKY